MTNIDSEARLMDYAKAQHDFAAEYFQHKETTAHAGLAVQLTLLSVLVAADTWPPKGLSNAIILGLPSAALWVTTVFFLLHLFIRHQLRFARWAAIQRAAALRIIRQFTCTGGTPQPKIKINDQTLASKRSWCRMVFCAWRTVLLSLDYIVPVQCAPVLFDQVAEDEPPILHEAILAQQKAGSRSLFMEWFVTIGSLFLGGTAVLVAITKVAS